MHGVKSFSRQKYGLHLIPLRKAGLHFVVHTLLYETVSIEILHRSLTNSYRRNAAEFWHQLEATVFSSSSLQKIRSLYLTAEIVRREMS